MERIHTSGGAGAEQGGPAPNGPDDGTTPPDPPFPAEVRRPHASEAAEREAALRRGRERRARAEADEDGAAARRRGVWAANPAFAALADNVRDYAIFLLDPEGVITFWGEGAHLMKWWTREEAEGAHLRLLYPEDGAEDGTAEDHLRDAEIHGESQSEGCRVRRDGSTFWAGVTLTALRNPEGELLGFAKTTRDLSARRAAESAVAMAHAAHSARDAAVARAAEAQAGRERAEEAAEFAQEHARGAREYINNVLEPELAAERARHAALRAGLKGRE
ncbi:MAG TPA: PAS domain S-box protein [Longimicrobium sp.]|jgi:PAS domain S-box-containing protein|uniref:PAS domain-containing protein n=1 Tax=Longimicrobium sp. TaxID=2029185 RepID=UPI002ED835FC